MNSLKPNPLHELPMIDRENAFMVYAAMAGDIERTAHALNVSPVAVLAVVEEEKWIEKLRPIFELKKSGRPGDLERGINRALNFVMAHRYRLFLERVVRRFTLLSDEELDSEVFQEVEKKNNAGQVISIERRMNTRALADLASALEKCHAMTYAALNDSTSERVKRKEDDGGADSVSNLHAKIAQAMADAGGSKTLRAQLFDAQLQTAQELPCATVEGQRRAAVAYLENRTQAVPPAKGANAES